eukprot:gene20798-26962_t
MTELSSEGVNFGKTEIIESELHLISNRLEKPLFQLKLDSIASCVIPTNNKDEVELQFHDDPNSSSSSNRDDDTLIQITFHFPSNKQRAELLDEDNDDGIENSTSLAEQFQKEIIKIGVVPSLTGDIIVEFSKEQGNFITPRGKYALQMTSSYMYMQGAQYAYKIAYSDINSLFLLPKLDGGRMAFVIALEKPIRQGNQKYQYLVIETHKVPQTVTVNLSDEDIARDYDGQLQKEMNMPLCNLIAKIFKVLSQKTVYVPKHFVTSRGGHAVRCSLKANDGLLYPLAKSFIFINKPTVHIKFEDVELIDFKRMELNTTSATKNFDLVVSIKQSAVSVNEPKEYTFSSIDRSDYSALFDYFSSKDLPVNKPPEVNKRAYAEDDDDDVAGDKESLDSEEEDDDYVGGGDDDESDDDASEDEDDDDEGNKAKSKKRSAQKDDSNRIRKKTKSDD